MKNGVGKALKHPRINTNLRKQERMLKPGNHKGCPYDLPTIRNVRAGKPRPYDYYWTIFT